MSANDMSIRLSLQTGESKHQNTSQPTPPVTPTVDHDGSLLGVDTLCRFVPVAHAVTSPRNFPDGLEYQSDSKGRKAEFGRGAWSIVYMASWRPSTNHSVAPGSRVVAVKSPVRRDAHSVLDAEALALTRICMVPGFEDHIVPFHGYIAESHSIVMTAVPLALSTYIEEKASAAKKHMSTSTMFDPVQGMAEWHGLAKKLVAGLAWLHQGPQMVHGDIKPHNLLLRPRPAANNTEADDFPFDPLFADFSSAHPIADGSDDKAVALNALTPPFTAPELLSVSSLTSPGAVPTPASDVFSLAVTLLAAATGDLLIYPGTSNMQRLAMAREGHRVIELARSGANGCRIPRNGIVEQIIKPAISKEPSQRIHPAEWLDLVIKTMA